MRDADVIQALKSFAESGKVASLYVDVATARRFFHILVSPVGEIEKTDVKLSRLIESAKNLGAEVLLVHVPSVSTDRTYDVYPLLLNGDLFFSTGG
jgi:hypothetical protein